LKGLPILSEQGKKEGEKLIESFKEKMKDACEEILGEVYVDLMPHIESDSWLNYRNDMRSELEREYFKNDDWLKSEEIWACNLRKAFYKQFKNELIDARVKDLEKEVAKYKEWYHEACRSGL
jgi:hypothetical protein